jgi:ribosomal protein S18 acetylase RimI-like enzyme
MASEIVLRNASREEAAIVVQMIRLMMTDMASYGGHPPTTDDSAWKKLATAIGEELSDASFRYVFAQLDNGEIAGVSGAKLVTLSGAFAPKKTAHISVIYVRPQFRRQRIGHALMANMLEWAALAGAVECDLNVLMKNPAKSLYAKHGFSAFQVKMVRPLPK